MGNATIIQKPIKINNSSDHALPTGKYHIFFDTISHILYICKVYIIYIIEYIILNLIIYYIYYYICV